MSKSNKYRKVNKADGTKKLCKKQMNKSRRTDSKKIIFIGKPVTFKQLAKTLKLTKKDISIIKKFTLELFDE